VPQTGKAVEGVCPSVLHDWLLAQRLKMKKRKKEKTIFTAIRY
jgi:hypothetical protein